MPAREQGVSEEVLVRIKAEYLELPGLRLTLAQARRLWNLDTETCERALAILVEAGFLQRTPAGQYARRHPDRRADEAA
jgi:Fic family protein